MDQDAIDDVVSSWTRERPDLDLTAVAVVGRVGRAALLLRAAQESALAALGLRHGEFDVLATLRRAGGDYTLTPSALADSMLLSRAAMTTRLDRLESAGLLTRELDPDNRRSFKITLTEAGHELVDRAITSHAARTDALLEGLSEADVRALDRVLGRLLSQLEVRPPG